MRVTTAFDRLLRLDGVNVTDVMFGITTITVTPGMAQPGNDAPVTVLAYRLSVTSTFGERPWFWEGSVQDVLARAPRR